MPLIAERSRLRRRRRSRPVYGRWLPFAGLSALALVIAVLCVAYDRTYRPAANWGLSGLLVAIAVMLFAVDAIPKGKRRR